MVHYESLDIDDGRAYEYKLVDAMRNREATELMHFEIEDKAMEQRLVAFARENNIDRTELTSPMFTCSHESTIDQSGQANGDCHP